MICKHILFIMLLNEPDFFYIVKYFLTFLSNTTNSIFY